MILQGKTYDTVKYFAQVVIPAIGALYFALSQVWGLPGGEQVVGSVVAVDTFLGVLLHISSTNYENSEAKYDGSVDIIETANKKTYSLNLNDDPEKIDKNKELRLKVNSPMKTKVKKARKRTSTPK